MVEKEFNNVLEKYLVEGYMTPDEYERMDEGQVFIIQAIKRARKRIKSRSSEEKTYE